MISQNLTQLFLQAFERLLEDVNGPMVGLVKQYEATPHPWVNVQPLIQLDFDGEPTEASQLQKVPVSWPGDATYRITWPLTANASYVKLLPLGGDHSAWLASGVEGQAAPSARRFDLSDIVAEPIPPWSRAHPVPANSVAADGMVVFAPKIYLGGADASKAVGLHGDGVNKDASAPAADFASWMTSVEAVAQAGGGVVAPAASTITQIGTLNAPSTVLKGK